MKDSTLRGYAGTMVLSMFDIVLHTGVEHPDIWWVVVPSLLAFLAGIGVKSMTGDGASARLIDEVDDC